MKPKRLLAVIVTVMFLGTIWGQSSSLGTPLATVKLIRTEIITEQAFKQDVQKLEAAMGRSLTEDERKKLLDDKINEILFLQMCERDGIRIADSELDAYINQMKMQLGNISNEQFEKYLNAQGITLDALKKAYKNQLLLQKWVTTAKANELKAIPPISADEILKAYEMYRYKLVRPDTVRISFLYYPFKEKTDAEKKKAYELMRGLLTKLQKNQETFDSLRLKSQEDGYLANKDSVYFEKSDLFMQQFGKQVYDTVFSLKEKEMSGIIETETGLWIIMRYEFYPQKQLELTDNMKIGQTGTVQDYLGQLLLQQRQTEFMQKVLSELFEKLRKQAEIKIIGKP
ncbi:MAG TPA: SurA N-terminal domain-containing protein [Spirochaetia bacterium]|nr:SurA N-terminal domain-containing protein [Spirochaetales bacterium]HOT60157.1 SurA N-terminal domain-containing protein [Spirochaetales bacterium]HPD80899.1 SurA N-terminal domain-containing protein [Spirochaetales bacterium]HQK33482.1 SurA N-terminal domain-containing protein [Spirochaetales bacterium]HRS66123.1 SurA N-terminal domain-containing protein [Spirochaetia bacterium]